MFKGKVVLITGGTGTLGNALVEKLGSQPKKVIVLSRDEFKQDIMQKKFSDLENLRFLLGDVRDKDRLKEAFIGVDYVIHTAALKQVPATEYNPTEAIKTNIDGTKNVVEACIACGVEKAVFTSSDKAVNPINLYGATKLVGEKLFLAANAYNKTAFSCTRYGNVIGSRGSVVPLFQKLRAKGIKEFPITSMDMTRFWITIDEAVDLVFYAFAREKNRISVPYARAASIVTIAKAIDPQCAFRVIGLRPGEKVHEVLISEDNDKVIFGNMEPRVFTSDEPAIQMTIEEVKEKML